MDKTTSAMLALQGEMRVAFMRMGVSMQTAGLLAREAMHLVGTSPVATDAVREAYARILASPTLATT